MKYSIVYADPPWHYNDRHINPNCKDGKKTRFGLGAAGRYPVMGTKDICTLPVQKICAPNCALLLWATFPRLGAALEVIGAWGFDYKTVGFLWIKLNPGRVKQFSMWGGCPIKFMEWMSFFGIGYYTKSNPELCLLGIKGRMKPVSNYVSNLMYAPRGRHSEKPAEARDKIVQLFGDLPRIELFARQRTPGWDVLGFDIDGRDIRESL